MLAEAVHAGALEAGQLVCPCGAYCTGLLPMSSAERQVTCGQYMRLISVSCSNEVTDPAGGKDANLTMDGPPTRTDTHDLLARAEITHE